MVSHNLRNANFELIDAVELAARWRVPESCNDRELAGLRRMWDGGPLRQFGETQASGHYVAYSSPFLTGYAGSYVCDRCLRPCAGVYLVKPPGIWLCGSCKAQQTASVL